MSEKDKPKKHYFNYQLLYRRTALIIYDILSVTAASFLALLLRYDMHVDAIPDEFILPVRNFLPLNILLTLLIFYFFRLYHSLWAFAGENEMQNLVIACFLSAIVSGIEPVQNFQPAGAGQLLFHVSVPAGHLHVHQPVFLPVPAEPQAPDAE